MLGPRVRRHAAALAVMAGLLAPLPAEANVLCTWFGRCLYESPGFQIIVVDQATGQPLADVHGLAEWVQHGSHGRAGPLMVQDALSGTDGVLVFPAWGPTPGYRRGLMLNLDPALTLFKPGYRTLLIQNAYPRETTETTRLRRFGQDGQTFRLEPFRGSVSELIVQFDRAIAGAVTSKTQDQLLRFRDPYLTRRTRVWEELQKLPTTNPDIGNYVRAVERDLRYLQELGQ
jgi:hypothetical protein